MNLLEKGFYLSHVIASGPKELEPRYQLKAKVLVTGFPGTGKTKLISTLGEKLHLDLAQTIKIGNLLRMKYKEQTRTSSTGYIPRNQSDDEWLDGITAQMITDPSERPFFLEAQLACLVAYEKIGDSKSRARMNPKVITVLLKCKENERRKRVFIRDREEKPDLTQEASNQLTLNRELLDLKQWKKTHPILRDNTLDPRKPSKQWESLLYDIVIDTTGKPVWKVEKELIDRLIRLEGIVQI